MSASQVEIARRVGLDVSSVNKILNRTPGPVFRKATIDRVFKVANELGYQFQRDTKPLLKRRVELLEKAMRELIPQVLTIEQLAALYHVPPARAAEIKEMLYGKKSA